MKDFKNFNLYIWIIGLFPIIPFVLIYNTTINANFVFKDSILISTIIFLVYLLLTIIFIYLYPRRISVGENDIILSYYFKDEMKINIKRIKKILFVSQSKKRTKVKIQMSNNKSYNIGIYNKDLQNEIEKNSFLRNKITIN